MEPIFFETRAKFRAWLKKNHNKLDEAQIGFYKKSSAIPSMTYQEAVDEALCFGWIDGKMNSLGATAYMQRFTPRKPKSNWSEINIKRAKELIAEGRMEPAGLAAFQRRPDEKTATYSYEQRKNPRLPTELEKRFRSKKKAWAFFESQSPGYRRTALYWVISAKREDTRERRLEQLIEHSAAGRRHPQFG